MSSDSRFKTLRTISHNSALLLATVSLFLATSLINVHIGTRFSSVCDSNATRIGLGVSRDECESQRRVTFLFIVFCLIRLISSKFETIFGGFLLKSCSLRLSFTGVHFGAALGFPYLTRSLSSTLQISSTPLFILIIFASTSIAFYPYVTDFAKLCRLIYNGVQRRHYSYNHSLITALISLYIYFSTIFIELLDVSFGIYCPQTIFGLPILFPNLNFPLLLFILHLLIISNHKTMPAIIYEVNSEDCFIQLNRKRCLTNKDCPQMSRAFPLDAVPSRTTTLQRRTFEGRIIQVRDFRELDEILPCKIAMHVRKPSSTIPNHLEIE